MTGNASPPTDPFHDETMQRLGAILHAEVDDLEPSAGSLAAIRQRHEERGSRTKTRWLAPLAAAAAVVAIAAAAILLPHGDQGTTTAPAATAPAPGPSDPSGLPRVSPVPSICAAGPSAVTVYWVADVASVGPRLYGELTTATTCGAPVEESLGALFAQTPADADYLSLWPGTTRVLSVSQAGSISTIDLSEFPTLGAEAEMVALQQLVWTATANDKTVKALRLLVNGETPASGHIDWSQPLSRGAALGTLANVWILAPGEGTTVGSPVTVEVYGTGYEGNVPLKVFRDGVEVASTFVTTEMGAFREASTILDLPAGTYELRAYNDSGQDSSLQLWDTKTFTVT